MPGQAAPEAPDRQVIIDLAITPLRLVFSDDALAYSAAADLLRGDVPVFHLKYLPARQGFVVNDQCDGGWGAEVFLALPLPEDRGGVAITLSLQGDAAWLRLAEGPAIALGDRFDLTGPLRPVIPASIDAPRAAPPAQAAAPAGAQNNLPAVAWDTLIVSEAGFFLEGWSDDRAAPCTSLVLADRLSSVCREAVLHRLRRSDIEDHLQPGSAYAFGLWAVAPLAPGRHLGELDLRLRQGAAALRLPEARVKPASEFLDFLLTHFGQRHLIGDPTAQSFADLDAGHGATLGQIHDTVAATNSVRLEVRFGPRPSQCRISLVCVLFGAADLMYQLVGQFARFGPLDGIEFVFVSNSPELEDALARDADLASFVFHARIVLISMNRNCGFGHANNVGVERAQAATVCIINPDVYPRDAASVAHMLGRAQAGLGAVLAGGRLHYADGSVMHEGMVFAEDRRLSALAGRTAWSVEHPRKGFPDTSGLAVRRVPAVSGALMLLDKALYERVQGFDTGYIHGYYEDADLCLRLAGAGAEVVVDPRLAFWHYEGKGSAGHPTGPGARLYNRWRFTRRWDERLRQMRDA